jgi:glycosyltransferase involved in cell wall biosynthesis
MSNKPMPSVSVVIPVHNGQAYLAEAINSVIHQQGLNDLEVIIIDDGSIDDSAHIAKNFEHVQYHYQAPQGVAAARNAGAAFAGGDYLAFLDADDIWVPNKLAMQIKRLLTQEHLDMVFCMVQQFISPDLNDQQRARIACPSPAMRGYIPSALLLKKSTFEHIGAFQTQWRVGEFIDWYSRAKELGCQSDIVVETLLKRRLHLSNTGVTERDSRQEFARILKASLDRKRRSQP